MYTNSVKSDKDEKNVFAAREINSATLEQTDEFQGKRSASVLPP